MSAVLAERLADSEIGGMAECRLEWHFDNWRRWMRSEECGRDYPARSCGFAAGGYSRSFDEMMDASDLRCARAVDALVVGLQAGERAAIGHTYLHAVFRFARGSLPFLLAAARLKVARGLVARGFY